MKEMEEELRRALQRTEPPDGFADRVLARLPQRRSGFSWLAPFGLSRSWAPAAAAALVVVVGAGSWGYHRIEQHRQQQAAQVKAELFYALELTSAKLQATRAKLLKNTGGTI